MKLAPEGIPQMLAGTVLLGAAAAGLWWVYWPAAIPVVLVWVWSIAFFRDPRREASFGVGELCSPADGTVTDITELEGYAPIEGPAVRIGVFLSLFNVHINRSPCAGVVRSVQYRPGAFHAAMRPQACEANESNTVVIDASEASHGDGEAWVVVRQVAGMAARRIVCHAKPGTRLEQGARFGLIKFGSRTELIIPRMEGTQIGVRLGDKVRAGLTVMARQGVAASEAEHGTDVEDARRVAEASA